MQVNLISSVVIKINQAQEPRLILGMKLTDKGQTLAFEKPRQIDGYQLSIAEDGDTYMSSDHFKYLQVEPNFFKRLVMNQINKPGLGTSIMNN